MIILWFFIFNSYIVLDKGSAIQWGFYVVDDGLHIVWGLLQIPNSLIGAGLVLESGGDEETVDCSAATGRVLQNSFRLE